MKHIFFLVTFMCIPIQFAYSYSSNQIESVTTQDEAQINRVREQEIQQIKIVLGRRFQESRRPDIILRLAELYVEKYRFYFLKENEIYQGLLKQGSKPSKVDHTQSREALKFANQYCKLILKSKVQFDKMDQVYYFLGYNASEVGNDKEAIQYFKLVVEKFPRSVNAADAYRELGEYYYGIKKYKEAVFYFERAAAFTQVPSYPRTLYKLAWSKFRTRSKTEALNLMKKVISVSSENEKFVSLREESVRDMVFFYADIGNFNEAKEYFSSIKGGLDIYIRALSILAGTYERDGKYNLALGVNRGLFEEYGESKPEVAFQILRNNVELYHKLGDNKNEEIALNRMVKYFTDHSDAILTGEDAKTLYLQAKVFLRLRVTELHKEAQKKKNLQSFSRSADLYEAYMNAFLKSPKDEKEFKERAQIRVYKVDALLAAGRESEAMADLEKILLDEYAESKMRKEAGTTLLNILIKKIDTQTSTKTEEKFLDVADLFEKNFPNDSLVAEIKYKRVRLEVSKSSKTGLSSSSRKLLIGLIEKYPSRNESIDSAQDLVADLIKKNDNKEAVELAQQFLSNQSLIGADKKGDLKKYLQLVISRQSFQNIKELEGDKDYLKAAQQYEQLSKQSSDKEVQNKSINNAAVNYELAGQIDNAFKIYEKTGQYDDLKRIAIQQVAQSKFQTAAELYLKLGGIQKFSSDERKAYLRSAYMLSSDVGDKSVTQMSVDKLFSDQCKKINTLDCSDLGFDIVHNYLKNDKPEEALNFIKAHFDMKSAEVNFEIAELYLKLHEANKAATYFLNSAKAFKKNSSAREKNFAAHSAYILAEPVFNSFQQIKLELPEDKFKVLTKKKLELVEKVAKSYQSVISYGDGEWGIASFAQLYRAFSSFADEILSVPVPERIAKDTNLTKQYKDSLSSFVKPMSSRALEYLKQGYQKGLQLGITAPVFVSLSRDLSNELPSMYPPAEFIFEAIPNGIVGSTPEKADEIATRLKKNNKDSSAWVELGNVEIKNKHFQIAKLAYEQALHLNQKDAFALNNLAILNFRDRDFIEAGNLFQKASQHAEFNKEIKHNLGRFYLGVRQFSLAVDVLKPIAARFADQNGIQQSYAVALIGASRFSEAKEMIQKVSLKKSDEFSGWYNWCVFAIFNGLKDEKSKDDREDAIDLLKDNKKSATGEQLKSIDRLLKTALETLK